MRIHFHSYHNYHGTGRESPALFQYTAQKLPPPRLYHAYVGVGTDGLVALVLLILLGSRMLWRLSGALAERLRS